MWKAGKICVFIATMKTFKRSKAIGFFDEDFRLAKLTKLGDPLVRLGKGIDFNLFRPYLEEKLQIKAKGKGGRPPFDYVLLFKILVLQRFYNLSDDQMEYQICDRLSFMRFLGLTLADDVPDSKTVWHYREKLKDMNMTEDLFSLFLEHLNQLGLAVQEGKIVDASFVEVPRQRNSREENKSIKAGKVPEGWEKQPCKLAQKDVDARWTKKNHVSYYGYKNHVKCETTHKFVTQYKVTHAAVNDSQVLELINEEDRGQVFYADSAYKTSPIEQKLISLDMPNKIIERAYRNTPLTEEQKKNNKEKSKVRARIEHIFGFVENSMNGSYIRTIGLERATAVIGLMNLTYNMFRKIQVVSAS